MERYRPRLMPALALALLSTPTRAAAVVYTWPDISGATHFDGSLSAGGKTYRVRLSSPRLVCPEDCDFDLSVFDDAGRLLGKLTTVAGSTDSPKLPAFTPPRPANPPEQPDLEDQAEPLAERDDQLPAATPDTLTQKPAAAASQGRVRGKPSIVSLSLGLGRESLTANAGVSDYSGATVIGATILGATLRPSTGRFGFDVELGAHHYTTSTKEDDVATQTVTTHTSKFLRLGARAAAFYDFLEDAVSRPSLSLGLGGAYLRMPALTISEPSTGAADLNDQSAIAPVIMLAASTRADARHQGAARLEYTEASFSKPWGTKATAVTALWRYALFDSLASELSIHFDKTRLSGAVDCQAVATCNSTSTVTSTILQARFGVGYRF